MNPAEPAWKPVWTVNGDDASWTATTHGDDGECHIEGIPGRLGNRTTLDLFVTKLGCHSALCNLEPDELRAIRAIIDEQLVAIEEEADNHGHCPFCGTALDYQPQSIEQHEYAGAKVPQLIPASFGCPECGVEIPEDRIVRVA